MPALADGGAGGTGPNGTGGAGGADSSTADGGDGGDSSQANVGTTYGGGGGGGGAGVTGGNGGEGAAGVFGGLGAGGAGGGSAGADGSNGVNGSNQGAGGGGGGAHGYVGNTLPTGAVSGGKGGNGGWSTGGGGGGGAGGYGAVVTGTGLSGTISDDIAGGDGGVGGNGGNAGESEKGAGGSGGLGLQFTGSGNDVTIDGAISGGDGGSLGSGLGSAVPAGDGGTGLDLDDGNTVTINGSVTGGNGGDKVSAGTAGLGGTGLTGENADVMVSSSGSVTGGYGGSSGPQANAITFTGGLNSLTLEAGATISGAVAGAGSDALQLKGSADDSLDASLFTGFSSLGKSGTGMWTITGSGFTGDTTISDGTLSVDGMIGGAGATTTVNAGTLGGSGTVLGTVLVNAGGAIGPGNSIGTLAVTGTTRFAVGSFYDVEVDDAGGTDLLEATDVEINGGTVRISASPGSYAASTQYTIVTATNAVTGEFDAVTSDLAFLTPELSYDPTNVYLTLVNRQIAFATAADTTNQRNVASALQQFSFGDPLFDIVIFQSADGARQAFDALSGEVHATLPGILLNDSRYVRDAILSRLQQASHAGGAASSAVALLGTGGPTVATLGGETMMGLGSGGAAPPPAYGAGLAFWSQGFGAWGNFDGDGNAASADRTLGGFMSGVDAGLGGGWRAGIAAGYSQADVDARLSSADVDSYHLAAYAGGRISELALRAGGAWTWHDIDTTRTVVFPNFLDRTEASYDADTGQIFAEAALPMGMGDTAIEPFAGIAYVHVNTGGFTESGGLAALSAAENDEDVGYSTLGLRAAATMRIDGVQVTPRASIAWQHAFGDVNPDLALAFNANGIGFGISGVPIARDSALVDAGVDLAIAPDATIGVSYLGQLARDVEDHGIKGRFDWRF